MSGFVFTKNCSGLQRSRFPNAEVVVTLQGVKGKGRPEIRVTMLSETCARAKLSLGDGVDVGFDRGGNAIRVQRCDENPPCHLSLGSKGRVCGRLRVTLAARDEWDLPRGKSIPMMPCRNVQALSGAVTAVLPDSWRS